jgi:hypothetical protein
MQPLMRELLDHLNLAPGQLAPNAWRTVVGSMVMWKVLSDGKDDLTLDELLVLLQAVPDTGFSGLLVSEHAAKGLEVDSRDPIVQQGMERQLRLCLWRQLGGSPM